MKIKEATKIARVLGYNYISADADLRIYAHTHKPILEHSQWDTTNSWGVSMYIGIYTGSKSWKDTLRRVKQ